MTVESESPILYFGTPVALISSLNEDGVTNLAPMSSIFWLGWRAVLGLSSASKTAQNLLRSRECVINLPTAAMADAVDRLALTTGSDPVPSYKAARGYRHVADKFSHAGLTSAPGVATASLRVAEAPVQIEAVIEDVRGLAADDASQSGKILIFEARVAKLHLHPSILKGGDPDRVDPDLWRPLIMSFQEFYGLGPRLRSSNLATIPEGVYRSPDVDRARAA